MRQSRRGASVILAAACLFCSFLYAGSPEDGGVKPEQPLLPAVSPSGSGQSVSETPAQGESAQHFSIFHSLKTPPEPITGRERLYHLLNSSFGATSMLRSAAAAGIGQAWDFVPEWGQGMDGYSARLLASMGRRMIGNGIDHGMSRLLEEDPRYYGSGRTGIWERGLYAAAQTFVTHTASGRPRFAYAHVLGTVSGLYISRRWHPERTRTAGEYATSIAVLFGIDAATHVASEFWPDIRRLFVK
jgi:hypothetical protein